ncbi:MAG: thioredoxin-disulfide reductase [Candidatus Methanofastidiosia archaeon]
MFDVIIVGGGPAGLTAGIYSCRAMFKTLLFEKSPGGQVAKTDIVENYPGFPDPIPGLSLMEKMKEQAYKFGLEMKLEEVLRIDVEEKVVKTSKKSYKGRAIIVATGVEPKKLNVPGEGKFFGRGVSYCAICDGGLFYKRKVVVVGGGDAALKEALYLGRFCERVYLIHRRDELRAEKILQEKAFLNEKLKLILSSVVREIRGRDRVSEILYENLKTKKLSKLKVEGIFPYIGNVPDTDLIDVKKDEEGYILTDENMMTSVEGIFAAGDCRSKPVRQITTAVGDGTVAALSVDSYITRVYHSESFYAEK